MKFREVVNLFHDILEDRTGERFNQVFEDDGVYLIKKNREKGLIFLRDEKGSEHWAFQIHFWKGVFKFNLRHDVDYKFVERYVDFVLKELED